MEDAFMTIGEKLKMLRKAHGYTQDYVASELDIIRQTYSHYETGRYTPGAEILYKIAKLYSVPVESLIELTLSIPEEDKIVTVEDADQTLLQSFIQYSGNSYQEKRLKYLNQQERLLIYTFSLLTKSEQQDLLDFLTLKSKKRLKQNTPL